MEAIQTITILPSTKTELANYMQSVKESILNGYISAEKSAIQLKAMENIIDGLKKDPEIKAYFLAEFSKHGAKSFENGAKFSLSTRKTWDFDDCNDSKYNELTSQLEAIKSQLKEREEFLKLLKEPMAELQGGEIINPPTWSQIEVVSITLNK